MGVSGDVICLQARSRPALFGVAELDNVLANGGAAPGMAHVVEPACREGVSGTGIADVMRDGAAAMAFAAGFGARSGAPACWLGPPRDLLTSHAMPEQGAADWLRVVEEPWGARAAAGMADFASADVRVIILDIRRAGRLSSPLRLAQKLVKRGLVAVLLAADAEQVMPRLGVPASRWRIGAAGSAPDSGAGTQACWQVELTREDAVRRVLVRACDDIGRMAPAPRAMEPHIGKEMMRRFARV